MNDTAHQSAIRSADDLPNTDLLGKRPPVLLGCDTHELATLVTASALLAVTVSLAIATVIGFTYVALTFICTWILTCGGGMVLLQGQKRQKPYGFYIQKTLRALIRWLPGQSVYVPQRTGWDTRRYRPLKEKRRH